MPKTLLDLKDRDCRYVTTDGPPYIFCAEPAMVGESYCPCHQAVVYGAALPRKKHMVCHVGFDLKDGVTNNSVARFDHQQKELKPVYDVVEHLQAAFAEPAEVGYGEVQPEPG